MIVDCHTRLWSAPEQMGVGARQWLLRNSGTGNLRADSGDHGQAARGVDRTLVWGFRSQFLNAEIPNAYLAEYVAQRGAGFWAVAGVDPPESDVMTRLENISRRREFVGVTLSPAAGNFHPADTRAMNVYAYCAHRGMPVFVESGIDLAPAAPLEFARPWLYDEVARTFPNLTLVISQLGWPWVAETVALLGKQPRVYAEIGALLRRPWEAYQALLLAWQAGVADKLLFGSDFPFATAAMAMERLYRLNEPLRVTGLPAIPRELLRGIVERDCFAELGISPRGQA
jgi:hypothetical protein